MIKSTIIESIYYKDNSLADHLIIVLFKTNKGLFVYENFRITKASEFNLIGWKKFEKFEELYGNCNNEKKIISDARIDEEMALIVLLNCGDFIIVFFDSSRIVGVNSAQVLDIFPKEIMSETFSRLYRKAVKIGNDTGFTG